MILNLKKAFAQENYREAFQFSLDLSDVEFDGVYPFAEPILISAKLKNSAGVVTLNIFGEACYEAPCDRCATNCSERIVVDNEYILATEVENEDNDNILLVTENELNLAELSRTDVLLQIPMKHLCSPDCKGLCSVCGTNLNKDTCSCDKKQIDPRLAALAELLK